MARYKTHLIAVNKFNSREETIMRDVHDAMEYLATIMNHHSITPLPNTLANQDKAALANRTPATHIYCYDARVVPFPDRSVNN